MNSAVPLAIIWRLVIDDFGLCIPQGRALRDVHIKKDGRTETNLKAG